jgi:hypothetical protein
MCNAWNHSADCECGFGGDTAVYRVAIPSPHYWTYRDDDYTRPTSCPICGAQVYFVRHNGGSAWFDDLGVPWPKHACFYDEAGTATTHTLFADKGADSVGVVIETNGADFAPTGQITVRFLDGRVISETFQTGHLILSTLPGRLVSVHFDPTGKPTLTFLK